MVGHFAQGRKRVMLTHQKHHGVLPQHLCVQAVLVAQRFKIARVFVLAAQNAQLGLTAGHGVQDVHGICLAVIQVQRGAGGGKLRGKGAECI